MFSKVKGRLIIKTNVDERSKEAVQSERLSYQSLQDQPLGLQPSREKGQPGFQPASVDLGDPPTLKRGRRPPLPHDGGGPRLAHA